ncbi:Lipid A export ATP-binding/permease protein MsbA [compost metagenome]
MDTIKWLYTHINKSLLWIALGTILLSIESISLIVSVMLQKYIVDSLFYKDTDHNIFLILLLMAGSFLLYSLLYIFAPLVCHIGEMKIKNKLSVILFTKVQNASMSEIHAGRTANVVNYLTTDVSQLSYVVAVQIPKGIQNIIIVITLVSVIGMTSLPILIGVLATSLMYIVLGKVFSPRIRKISGEVELAREDMNVFIEESLSASKEIIASNRLAWEQKRYNQIFSVYFRHVLQQGKAENKYLFFSDPLKWGVNLFTLGFGGYQVYSGSMLIGTFIVIYQLIFQFTASIQSAFQFMMDFSGQIAHFDRLKRPFALGAMDEGKLELPQLSGSIHFSKVTFGYKEQEYVFENLQLEIPLGKNVAIVGSSGSGKSTIAQLLMRLYKPNSGRIYINGVPLDLIKADHWSGALAVVSQDPILFPDTIRNNLLMGMEDYTEERIMECCKHACIDEFIQGLPNKLDELVGERGIDLSGGQRQRLALARAFLRNPDILILDEATSALDYETERCIHQMIKKNRLEKTTLSIAHRLSTVRDSDVIFVLEQGEVVESGNHEQLMLVEGRYNRLVNMNSL